ncbi:MAG: hypothetical protein ACLP8S_00750 [Solirubrobacteraceae bacterium]
MNARSRRFQLATPRMAVALGVLSLLTVPATLVLDALSDSMPSSVSDWASTVSGIVFVLVLTAVGVVVARREPRNPIGWMLIAVALGVQAGNIGSDYAYLGYIFDHGTIPLRQVGVLLASCWLVSLMVLPMIILLFPDGRLGSRWRWPVRIYLVLSALAFAATVGVAVTDLGLRVPVNSSGEPIKLNDPHGVNAWFAPAKALWGVSLVLLAVAAVVYQVVSYHRASGVRRQQLKWLAAGAVVCVVCFVVSISSGGGSSTIGSLAFAGALSALPICIGVGILKYRLYEIDRLISRTLSYAILTGLLVGTFVGLIALTTDLLPFSSSVGVAASTLAAAALFNPLRKRVQRVVDRRFNRSRYDAEQTVAAFAGRLRDAVDLDTVQAELLQVVHQSVQPTHATIWIRQSRPRTGAASR